LPARLILVLVATIDDRLSTLAVEVGARWWASPVKRDRSSSSLVLEPPSLRVELVIIREKPEHLERGSDRGFCWFRWPVKGSGSQETSLAFEF
jgi:hypothetical protein